MSGRHLALLVVLLGAGCGGRSSLLGAGEGRSDGPVLGRDGRPRAEGPRAREARAHDAPLLCSKDGFCREFLLYVQGAKAPLVGVWGTGPTDVFAVGAYGSVAHYDGQAWTLQASGTQQSLHGIWGSGSSDVWAVGSGGTVLRYNGASWSPRVSGTKESLHAIWGTSATDVYAVGAHRTILRFDGQSWTVELPPGAAYDWLGGVWGTPAGTKLAVGDLLLRHDGAGWTPQPPPLPKHYGVWGTSTSNIFVVGIGGIARHDGQTWSPQPTPTKHTLYSVRGANAWDVWAVGDQGTIVHYDGAKWSSLTSGVPELLRGVWAGGGHVFVVTSAGEILHRRP